jgi:histidinol dehydrogenase
MGSAKQHRPPGAPTFIKAPARNAVAEKLDIGEKVSAILASVRDDGDAAVRSYSATFDKVSLEQFEVSAAERQTAVNNLAAQTRADTEFAIARVRAFARRSSPRSCRSRSSRCRGCISATVSSRSSASDVTCRAGAIRSCRRR